MSFFEWRRGSTFRMALQVISGSVSGSEVARCAMKKRYYDGPIGPELVVFDMQFVAANGGSPDQWVVTGTEAQSLSIKADEYIADARIELADGIVQTAPIKIRVTDRVTRAG